MSPSSGVHPTLLRGAGTAVASFISFWLASHVLARVHSISHTDDLLGAMWAVIATLFVYRTSYRQSAAAALTRTVATLVGFALCLIYLSIFAFHPVGLAVLIGIGAIVLVAAGRPDDALTCGITIAVVMVLAAVSPHHAEEAALLRVVDTALGIAVGLAAAWIDMWFGRVYAQKPQSADL